MFKKAEGCKNKRKRTGYGLYICCMLMSVSLLCSCSLFGKSESVPDSESTPEPEANTENAGNEQDKFDADTVFTVNGIRVSIGEWNLYSLSERSDIENLYGKEIWNFTTDKKGTTFEDAYREDIMEQIAYTKIVAGMAEDVGVALDEDDSIEISIETADYLSRLSDDECEQYGINAEVLKTVYSDNILARKVYERITLNIDTHTEETEVRHMVLQYVTVPKFNENASGEPEALTEEETRVLRTRFDNFKEYLDNNPGITLKEAAYGDFAAMELIDDYEGLKARFPEELAGIAFWLRDGEISEVYETEEAFFIFCCVKTTDDESTNKAKIRVLEQREKDCFTEKYEAERKKSVIEKNELVWYRVS